MISRAQENEGANTVDLKANLRSSSLLQLRLLDRDHVIKLLLTLLRYLAFQPQPHPPLHLHFPLPLLTSSLFSTSSSFFRLFLPFLLALFLLLPFFLLFLFLPFGVADIQLDKQTQGRIESEVMMRTCQHISDRSA